MFSIHNLLWQKANALRWKFYAYCTDFKSYTNRTVTCFINGHFWTIVAICGIFRVVLYLPFMSNMTFVKRIELDFEKRSAYATCIIYAFN